MMYTSPILLQQAEAEVGGGREHSLPFFPVPVILDEDLAGAFLGLHVALEGATSRLQRDSLLLSVLARFVQRHSETRPRPRPVGREHRAVKIVREYLEDNWTENVSLEQLARLANLSSFHLARTFRAEVGIPPHAYQLQVRTVRAKELLLRGWSVARVALEMGFADQSHFSRHFKRLVGVPPGSYVRNSKNVQDAIP